MNLSRPIRPKPSDSIHLRQLEDRIGFGSHDLQEKQHAHTTALEVFVIGFFSAIGSHVHLELTTIHDLQARAKMTRSAL